MVLHGGDKSLLGAEGNTLLCPSHMRPWPMLYAWIHKSLAQRLLWSSGKQEHRASSSILKLCC